MRWHIYRSFAMGTTAERRQAIRALLEEFEISSQSQLLEILEARGIATTQPALSRDLRALSVAKEGGVYRLGERVTKLDELSMLLRGARTAGDHLVVVRCEPGAASAIARAIEADQLDGVVGTVAGDDTVFLAVERKRAGAKLVEHLEGLMEP